MIFTVATLMLLLPYLNAVRGKIIRDALIRELSTLLVNYVRANITISQSVSQYQTYMTLCLKGAMFSRKKTW